MHELIPRRPDSDLVFRGDLLSAGVDDDQIARLIRSGVLTRVRRGAYCFSEVWNKLDARGRHLRRLEAALRAARTPTVGSHVSAAVAHTASFWDLDLRRVDLTRLDQRSGRHERAVRQHGGVLSPEDLATVNGLAVTSPTRTLLDVTSVVPVEQGLVLAEGLFHAGATSPELCAERLGKMQPWPGSLRTRFVLRLAQPRNTTVGESRAHYLFFREGLPAPIPQYEVRDRSGNRVAVLDFAWPKLRVFVEFDGLQKYGGLLRPGESPADAVIREKRREDRVRELTGWVCIRLTWADLENPGRTAARIRSAVALAAAS